MIRNTNKQDTTPKFKRETARMPTTTGIRLYSDDDKYVEKALGRIGKTIDEICEKNHWTVKALQDQLDPEYFPDASTMSRLLNSTKGRSPKAAQLFELRRVSGISLDALADGGNPFVYEELSDAKLVEIINQASDELKRRLWQE